MNYESRQDDVRIEPVWQTGDRQEGEGSGYGDRRDGISRLQGTVAVVLREARGEGSKDEARVSQRKCFVPEGEASRLRVRRLGGGEKDRAREGAGGLWARFGPGQGGGGLSTLPNRSGVAEQAQNCQRSRPRRGKEAMLFVMQPKQTGVPTY